VLVVKEQVMSSSIHPLAAMIALVAAVTSSVLCALLVWRHQRRLAAIQVQLDSLRRAVNNLELAHQGLLIRYLNLPKARRAQRLSRRSSDTLEKRMTAPAQADEKESTGLPQAPADESGGE